MSDLAALAVFGAFVLATLAIVRLCDWLRPRDSQSSPRSGSQPLLHANPPAASAHREARP